MFKWVITFAGIVCILFGLVLLTRKKFMIKDSYINIFTIIIVISPIISNNIGTNNDLFKFIGIIIIVVLPVLGIAFMINRERYMITNVKSQMVRDTLTDILKEKNISYDENKNLVILNDYDNKSIYYKRSFNDVDIRLAGVRNLSFYKELKLELKNRIKEIDTLVFPTLGLFYIIFGIAIIVVIH